MDSILKNDLSTIFELVSEKEKKVNEKIIKIAKEIKVKFLNITNLSTKGQKNEKKYFFSK